MEKKLQVLMSAYNGEKYIVEQLDSIFAQTYPNIEVLVRLDGSKDSTADLLREYQKKEPRLFVYEEENLGLTKSFLNLIEKSDADYVAFSDQDDFWLPNKLEVAVSMLEGHDEPALYCSNQLLTDANLNQLDNSNMPDYYRPGFGNALVETVCTGCTAVMNKALADNIKEHMPENAIWHDWWAYLVASYLGTVIFDKNAYILYRQHGGNIVGSSRSAFAMIYNKWQFLKKSRGMLEKQLKDFQKEYRCNPEKDKYVDMMLNSRTSVADRFKLAGSKYIYRQRKLDNMVVNGLFIINKML